MFFKVWDIAFIPLSYVLLKLRKMAIHSRGESLTSLGREHGDHPAERPVSLVVIHTHPHLKWGERGKGFVPVLIGGGVSRGHHLLLPSSCTIGPECHDVAETFSILEFFRDGLRAERNALTWATDSFSTWLRLNITLFTFTLISFMQISQFAEGNKHFSAKRHVKLEKRLNNTQPAELGEARAG